MNAEITPQSDQTIEHKVEGVSFDTDIKPETYKIYNGDTPPKMVSFVMKYLCLNRPQAEWLLCGFAIAVIIFSLCLMYKVANPKIPKYTLPAGQVIYR